jgi:hypothetical protein
MAEMRALDCPSCEMKNQPRSMVDGIIEYRCSSCGMVYYGPCGCDTVHETAEETMEARTAVPGSALPEDWAMATPQVEVLNGVAAQPRPGGC